MSKWRLFSSELPSEPDEAVVLFYHPQETLILCIVSVLDVVMTQYLLSRGDERLRFVESNPIAQYFLNRWGLIGMAYFKGGMTAFVCVITQIIARQNPDLAKGVLGLATVIIVGVVGYSVWLHFNHRGTVQPSDEAFVPAIKQYLKSCSWGRVLPFRSYA